MIDPVSAISPIDGRYAEKVGMLSDFFSERGLIKYRIRVEVEWLIFLCNTLKLPDTRTITSAEINELRGLFEKFSEKAALRVKKIEKITNHDVKAVEYFIKEELKNSSLKDLLELVHFACTSEDINNLSYALLIQEALDQIIVPALKNLIDELTKNAQKYKATVMLARTHGQPASPTTLGKELVVFVARLERQIESFNKIEFLGKMNGASGNYNAHAAAYEGIDWIVASEKFVKGLGLKPNCFTTQIESHDFLAELFDCFRRINTILLDLNRDIWTYISLGIFTQKTIQGEVGSSTMPHKVNPIDFENSEGNLGIANSLFDHFSHKLPVSRLQRDLSDSTVFRNIGTAFAHSLIAYHSTLKGLAKLQVNEKYLFEELDSNWEVLAEPIQTVMRKYKIEKPYEKLKELTRGKRIGKKDIEKFVGSLNLSEKEKKLLSKMTPHSYSGLAEKLVEKYLHQK